MKKLANIMIITTVSTLVAFMTMTPFSLFSQQKPITTNVAIPEKVMQIAKTSCMACHSDNGSGLAPSAINFDKWDTYSVKKQAKKAQNMCKEIKSGSMPPSSFLSKNPAAVLTPDKIAIICNWASSIQPVE